ncbi:glycoside hydrolase family 3 N-terminal domain-containing protein [Epilithonimonas ginsengisoli]|uniref:Glycoside hydrolase family 3 N-terminal domain-containing protein n=1 Tax=Epilithonimonas ginsengisoli TaxID=1245592 RepID=A0ABU4JL50_9FLAO|nr:MULTISPECIES: glycoside hydrolase family 3 N-terminal domain-containing protein [Chryseobacterium group]MBV6881458.1 glycoside hydrolase family 3 C-terminal domain-containing protein [Epilithonimonas sp. FP105]MDW8550400.1 glycoside hydrolase family 3 N-terminal domain-containing protein [Epilithonimonas ginsengisoli]OAH73287.1 glycosyl hydrolase [Chryseobacterium sp. FP211-J200]
MQKNISTLIGLSQKAKYSGLFLALLAASPFANAQTKNTTVTVDGKTFKDSNKNGKLDVWEDTRLSVDKRIDAIIKQMTNEEKVNLLIGTGMPGIEVLTGPVGDSKQGLVPGAAGGTDSFDRFGIPATIVADGPAGLRIQPTRDNDSKTYYATAFPVGTALASTWNKTLLEQVGKAMGNEVKEYGVDVLLAPALNIQRNPLNGRNFEYYSEDPLVAGKTAAAIVNGIQSQGVGTSIKHFAANNEETNRLTINAHVSERAMRELYLRNFEITVKESQPWTVMSSYNKLNGVYTSDSKDLLTQVLRNEWGFKGIVMTDWFGGFPGFESIKDGGISDVVKQMNAGNDLLMPGIPTQKKVLLAALDSGKLSQEVANINAKRILEYIFKTPTFAQYKYSDKPNLTQNAEVTRNAAAEGMVLLKNEKNALPFADKQKEVSLFGVTSYAWITGGTGSGSVNNKHTVSLLEGLNSAGYKLDKELVDLYKPHAEKEAAAELIERKKKGILGLPGRLAEMKMDDAFLAKKAETSEIAFVTLGRNSGEGGDRVVNEDFNLATEEIEMLDKISKAFHAKGKKVVVILNIGGVIETASWKDKVDAILLAWQPGQEGGHSVADVVSGKVNPSGKLTMTFPVNYADHASAKNFPGIPADNPKEVTYEEGVYVGYRYFNTFNVKPSYEFGFGKSYTDFAYSNLKLNSKTFNDKLEVTVEVKNTGKVAGKEVIELYLSAPNQSIDKPKSELKAYAKTKDLKPGESQTITLTLNPKNLASYITAKSAWVAEAGNYKVSVGASSLDIKQTADFSLPKELVVEKVQHVFPADKQFEDLKP